MHATLLAIFSLSQSLNSAAGKHVASRVTVAADQPDRPHQAGWPSDKYSNLEDSKMPFLRELSGLALVRLH
jgi:hypothetical protein